MRIFAVDDNNDLYLGANGRLALHGDLDAFGQACKHAMQALLGEMVFAGDRGLPYAQLVWVGNPQLRQFEEAARSLLLSIPGALAVTEFACEISGDALVYRAVISSIYGPAALAGRSGSANG